MPRLDSQPVAKNASAQYRTPPVESQEYNDDEAWLLRFQPDSHQLSGVGAVERRRLQNRDAQRRLRSKRSEKKTKSVSKATTGNTDDGLPPTGHKAIQPRPSQDSWAEASTGVTLPDSVTKDDRSYLSTHESSSSMGIHRPQSSTSSAEWLLTDPSPSALHQTDASASYLSQFQQPLDSLPLQSHLRMDLTDLNLSPPGSSYEPSQHISLPENHDGFSQSDLSNYFLIPRVKNRRWETSQHHRRQLSSNTTYEQDATALPTPQTASPGPPDENPYSVALETFDSDNGTEGDDYYQTSLHIAADGGHDNMVDMLLRSGAAVDQLDSESNTPLHIAVIRNRVSVLKRLLEHGANPNAKNAAGWTPVHFAVQTGSVEALQALMSHGGDLRKKARKKL